MKTLILSLIFASAGYAAEFALSAVVVKDGDTITADVHIGLDNLVFHDQTIRFNDIDCWETSKHRQSVVVTDDEVAKGKKARAELEGMVKSAKAITGATGATQRDVYGRRLFSVKIDGESVAEIMRAKGHERK